MLEIFFKGGPIMWPLLLTSVVALSVVFERIAFLFRERTRLNSAARERLLSLVEKGDIQKAVSEGEQKQDFVAEILAYGLRHKEESLSNALLVASNRALRRYNRGLSILDTIITLAPLLGLLGTVTGMIHSFGLLGQQELNAPTQITGGIAEALIATAFGLSIAILSLIPFNFLNNHMESARREIEEAVNHLELLLLKQHSPVKEEQ